MDPIATFNEIETYFAQNYGTTVLLRKGLLTVGFLLGLMLLQRALIRVLDRRHLDAESRYRWARGISYAVSILGFFLIGGIWFTAIGSIATLLAIVAGGLAIALREPLVNLGGWAYILWRHPFGLGDRVEVDMTSGDVANIGPFVFSLAEVATGLQAEQLTGRIVHVPNSYVFSYKVINSTQGFEFVWDEIPLLVTFESNWETAKDIISKIVNKHTREFAPLAKKQLLKATTEFMIPPGTFDPQVFTSVEDSGVLLTMRYVVPVRGRRRIREQIWEDVLRAFAQADDIDFAYPTQRFYFNRSEGKSGAGGNEPAAVTIGANLPLQGVQK